MLWVPRHDGAVCGGVCLLPTAYCLLPTAYRLLPTTYYLLRYLFVGEQVRDGLVARGDKRVGSEPVRL
jgi:hypothetical protein